MVYDVALWLAGCDIPDFSSDDVDKPAPRPAPFEPICKQVASLRTIKNVNSTVLTIPVDPGAAGGPAVTLSFYRVEQVRTIATKPWFAHALARSNASAVVLNAGLWNLRHDRAMGSPEAVVANYLSEVDALIAQLGASAPSTGSGTGTATSPLKSRLYWRTLLPLEHRTNVTQHAFTRAAVQGANAPVAAKWASAGYRVFDAWPFGVHEPLSEDVIEPAVASESQLDALLLTRDGIHYPAYVNIEVVRALLSAIHADQVRSGLGGEDGVTPSSARDGLVIPGWAVMAAVAAALVAAVRSRRNGRYRRVETDPAESPSEVAVSVAPPSDAAVR